MFVITCIGVDFRFNESDKLEGCLPIARIKKELSLFYGFLFKYLTTSF